MTGKTEAAAIMLVPFPAYKASLLGRELYSAPLWPEEQSVSRLAWKEVRSSVYNKQTNKQRSSPSAHQLASHSKRHLLHQRDLKRRFRPSGSAGDGGLSAAPLGSPPSGGGTPRTLPSPASPGRLRPRLALAPSGRAGVRRCSGTNAGPREELGRG